MKQLTLNNLNEWLEAASGHVYLSQADLDRFLFPAIRNKSGIGWKDKGLLALSGGTVTVTDYLLKPTNPNKVIVQICVAYTSNGILFKQTKSFWLATEVLNDV